MVNQLVEALRMTFPASVRLKTSGTKVVIVERAMGKE